MPDDLDDRDREQSEPVRAPAKHAPLLSRPRARSSAHGRRPQHETPSGRQTWTGAPSDRHSRQRCPIGQPSVLQSIAGTHAPLEATLVPAAFAWHAVEKVSSLHPQTVAVGIASQLASDGRAVHVPAPEQPES